MRILKSLKIFFSGRLLKFEKHCKSMSDLNKMYRNNFFPEIKSNGFIKLPSYLVNQKKM